MMRAVRATRMLEKIYVSQKIVRSARKLLRRR
jgi:hypothetical protein